MHEKIIQRTFECMITLLLVDDKKYFRWQNVSNIWRHKSLLNFNSIYMHKNELQLVDFGRIPVSISFEGNFSVFSAPRKSQIPSPKKFAPSSWQYRFALYTA
jgi:hypothetical protein